MVVDSKVDIEILTPTRSRSVIYVEMFNPSLVSWIELRHAYYYYCYSPYALKYLFIDVMVEFLGVLYSRLLMIYGWEMISIAVFRSSSP